MMTDPPRSGRSPALFVPGHVTRSDRRQIIVQGYGDRYYRRSWGANTAGSHDILIGTLIVDRLAAESQWLNRRGEGTATLSSRMSSNEES